METTIKNIDFEDYLKKHSPGYVIEVFKNDTSFEYVIGNSMTNPKTIKTTSDTLYDIASLTKTFTSVLVYKAYEENRINLNDTIYDIDNNFINLKDVTVLDLLSHNQNIWTNGYLGNAKTKEEFYNILYTAYVREKTPTYVDTHYIILGILLEKIYQKNYDELCFEKIFNVLNMKHTTFNPNKDLCASSNYEHTSDGVIDYIYPGLIHDTKGRVAKKFGLNLGHASIFTTGKDLLLFLESFFNNKILKKETIALMLKHNSTNEENYSLLKKMTSLDDVNEAYSKVKGEIVLPKTYNYMGVRYRNIIDEINDVPYKASDNSITFSGYTGPMFTIDFDNHIIVIVMCNVMHNTELNRETRKAKTFEIMNKIFDNLL